MATGNFTLKQVNQAIAQGSWSGYIAPKWVEYLVVAGGGAGGDIYGGGGGGAGGLLQGVVTITPTSSYTVTVGAGGSRVTGDTGGNGVNSLFGSLAAVGGGGGSAPGTSDTSGQTGGSGGGGRNDGKRSPGFGTPGQGNAGGAPYVASGSGAGGGGGGAGSAGFLGPAAGEAGNGGVGVASLITGVGLVYAGGGGGGTQGGTGGNGGNGGGGAGGSNVSATGSPGNSNTGGGGGGGGTNSTNKSGNGGSGVVIIRYPGNVQFFTGGAVTYVGGFVVHSFYDSGTLAPTTPAVVLTDYQISRSLRFNRIDNGYLTRTPTVASNRQTWTLSMWIKSKVNLEYGGNVLFSARVTGSPYSIFELSGTQSTQYALRYQDSNNSTDIQTSALYRDPSAWYHVVLAVDTTQATAANRVKIYVNSTQVTSFGTATYPSQNANTQVNDTTGHAVGGFVPSVSTTNSWDGYMTDVHLIDGQQLTPSSFGSTNTNTGVWQPISYTGTYGTNGFKLNFSDNSNITAATLGADSSGNGNNWTPNNFSVTAGIGNDSLVDVPTSYGTDYGVGGTVRGNYAVANPLDIYGAVTTSNGNLDISLPGGTFNTIRSTIGMSSGKWYWEVVGDDMLGISDMAYSAGLSGWRQTGGYAYYGDGSKYNNFSASAYGASFSSTDVIGVALDMDAGTLVFYKNGTSQGTAFSGLTGRTFGAYMGNGSSGTTNTINVNFGQRPFASSAPSGYKALVTTNLP